MEYEKLMSLKKNVDFLINGIDPQSKINIEGDTILSSNFNKRLLTDISDLIDKLIKLNIGSSKVDKRIKYEFYISAEDRIKIPKSESPIPISTFTHVINEHIDTAKMKKLRATHITTWLLKEGYLSKIEHEDGKVFKVLTEKSATIGMSAENKTNTYGRNYDVNLYNSVAQKFIIDHLDEIISNENKIGIV